MGHLWAGGAIAVLLAVCCVCVDPPSTPEPPLTPGWKCKDAMGCELNGQCQSDGQCKCITGWTGPSCGTLDLLPAKLAGAWPVQRPVPPSWWGDGHTPGGWGGSVMRADDGNHHIIAASGCYLPHRVMHMDGWQLSHGISTSGPEGPYKFGSVVSSATSFNPHTTRLPDGRYLLFHMGAHTVPTPSGYINTCTGNETAGEASPVLGASSTGVCSIDDCFNENCQPQQGALSSACVDAGCVLDPGFAECYPPQMNATKYLHVRIASSASGPWSSPHSFQIEGMPESVPSIAWRAADNPSPLVIPDRSVPSGYRILLAFRFPANDSWCGDHRCANSAIGIAEAFSWNGTYNSTGLVSNPAVGAAVPYLGIEDPTLFRGHNGSIHMLAHKYDSGRAAAGGHVGWPGLHAFSLDGKDWSFSQQHDGRGAYSFQVQFEGEKNATIFSRRERPELHVDPATGTPTFLISGVQYEADQTKSENDHRYSFVLVQRTTAYRND